MCRSAYVALGELSTDAGELGNQLIGRFEHFDGGAEAGELAGHRHRNRSSPHHWGSDRGLRCADTAVQFIPADGRDDPDLPFGPVVDPGADASLLLRIAGWGGRNVA